MTCIPDVSGVNLLFCRYDLELLTVGLEACNVTRHCNYFLHYNQTSLPALQPLSLLQSVRKFAAGIFSLLLWVVVETVRIVEVPWSCNLIAFGLYQSSFFLLYYICIENSVNALSCSVLCSCTFAHSRFHFLLLSSGGKSLDHKDASI